MRLRDHMPELGESMWINSSGVRREDIIGEIPTLIYFWSISCGSCKKSIPSINQIRDELKGKLNVISVHTPLSESDNDLSKVRSAVVEKNITDPVLVDMDERLSDSFNFRYVPAYYVFDKAGMLRHAQSGSGGIALLRRRLERVLKENS
ncbi:MAG: TlpA family protein disulfide reductase [Oceanobacillus sp.]|nr:TlpA family protein disulfide reductase [Oceanobacillus sp.]